MCGQDSSTGMPFLIRSTAFLSPLLKVNGKTMFQLQIISFHALSERRNEVSSEINSVIFSVSPVNVLHECSAYFLRLMTLNAEGIKCEDLNHFSNEKEHKSFINL